MLFCFLFCPDSGQFHKGLMTKYEIYFGFESVENYKYKYIR